MFRATYLGWQGWLLASGNTRLLVDPLLLDEVGHGPRGKRLDFHFWPPRVFDVSRIPPVDALFITHEHEDHFNPATLARIDRSTPVWLSSRSSRAARTLLAELGFQVQRVAPDATLTLGDLEVKIFGPNHIATPVTDEWDALSYAVRDLGGQGAFYTNVDIEVTPAARALVSEWTSRHAQVLVFEGMEVGLAPAAQLERPLSHSTMHAPGADTPFCDGSSIPALAEGRFLRPLSGQEFSFAEGKLAGLGESAFLRTPARDTWPQRPRFRRQPDERLAPFCGVENFADADWPELGEGLTRFAEYLYGRYVFRRLHSLDERTLGGRTPSFVWLLRMDDEDSVCALAYDPGGCRFELIDVPADLNELRYAGVVTSWATDLLALMRGDFEGRAIAKCFHEVWHKSCPLSLLTDGLWEYFHPLRHPEATLRRYRAAAADEASAPLWVHATGREASA